jgi:hypothetical protein
VSWGTSAGVSTPRAIATPASKLLLELPEFLPELPLVRKCCEFSDIALLRLREFHDRDRRPPNALAFTGERPSAADRPVQRLVGRPSAD